MGTRMVVGGSHFRSCARVNRANMVIPAKMAPVAIDNRPLLANADEVIKLPFGVPFRVIGNHRSVAKDAVRSCKKVSNGTIIFSFSDAIG